MSKKSERTILAAITSIALAFSYIAIGFALCAGVPYVTESLSRSNSAFNTSPYAPQELLGLAMETRDYTVTTYGRSDGENEEEGLQMAREALASKIINAARISIDEGSPTIERWDPRAVAILEEHDSSDYETMLALAEVDQAYGFDIETLSHLDDVNGLIAKLLMPLIGIGSIAAFCLMGSLRLFGYKSTATPLIISGIAVVAVLGIIGLWAPIDFMGFFAVFHSLFFAEDSWVFPADSLLISLYPEGFWIGMGITWVTVSCMLAAISIIAGSIIRAHTKKADEGPAARPEETTDIKTTSPSVSNLSLDADHEAD